MRRLWKYGMEQLPNSTIEPARFETAKFSFVSGYTLWKAVVEPALIHLANKEPENRTTYRELVSKVRFILKPLCVLPLAKNTQKLTPHSQDTR